MDKLIQKINEKQSPIVVGLDSNICFIPPFIKQAALKKFGNTPKAAAYAILKFNIKIIDEIFELVPAIKLQAAYYEMFGYYGVWALAKTIIYCKNKNLITILDGKRNDIGSSMNAYVSAYLGQTNLLKGSHFSAFDCDGLTVNPYLGSDSITPVFEACRTFDKLAFILVKTSNPGSDELQNLKLQDDNLFYEKVAEICNNFNDYETSKFGFNRLGVVVGATKPTEMEKLRYQLPHSFFLVPGFGAQRAPIQNLKFAFSHSTGAIINSSRAILGAWINNGCDELEFAKEAKKAVIKMKQQILEII